jgi:hypothetical protein
MLNAPKGMVLYITPGYNGLHEYNCVHCINNFIVDAFKVGGLVTI